jgi:tetratricopeptide (TPR) repeat protein
VRSFAISFALLIFGSGLAWAANSPWEESRRNGATAREQGQYAEARRWFETALTQAEFDDADLRRADLDDELAAVCEVIGDEAAADRLYSDALTILAKHPNDGADVRSIVLGGLGMFRARQGRLRDASDALEKAFAITNAIHGGRDPRLASLQSSLAQIDVMEGKLADAESLLQSAVKIQKTAPDSVPSERIASEVALGTLYMTEGRYSEAESILSQANEEASRLAKSYPWGGTMAALADLYRLEGKSSRSEPLLKRAQAIYAAAFGPESPRVADILLDRSIDSLAAKKSLIAESEIDRALEILRKANGREHPTVALAEFRLAQAYTQQSRYAEAEPLLRHALSIEERMYPEGHLLIADCLLQLAELERLRHRYPDSEQQYRNALTAYEKAGNPGSAGLAVALRQYAKLLRTSRTEEAKALEKRAEGLRRSVETFQ